MFMQKLIDTIIRIVPKKYDIIILFKNFSIILREINKNHVKKIMLNSGRGLSNRSHTWYNHVILEAWEESLNNKFSFNKLILMSV